MSIFPTATTNDARQGPTGNAWLKNLALALASLAATLLFLELVCFRLLWPATDMPENRYEGGVIKYVPGQQGVYRVKTEIAARYRINGNGWNSGHSYYPAARSDKLRVAVVGDSYVDALIVDYDQSLAERLEAKLSPERAEVFRFGMSGAPFSQYLQMLREEVASYAPDWVAVVLVHNDFDESHEFMPGRYTSSFLKLRVEPGAMPPVTELAPTPYHFKWYEYLRYSAMFRFLVYQQRLDVTRLKALVMGGSPPGGPAATGPVYQANIDVRRLAAQADKTPLAVDYLLGEMKRLARIRGFGLVLLMDGVREDIYAGITRRDGARSLNELTARLAARHGIPFLDLHPVFEEDYRRHRRPFNFQSDFHWNAYGHEIAAQTLYNYLVDHPLRSSGGESRGWSP